MKTREKLQKFNDGRIILKVITKYPDGIMRNELISQSGLKPNRFNDVWLMLKAIKSLKFEKEGTCVKVLHNENYQEKFAILALARMLEIRQEEKTIAFMKTFAKEQKRGKVNANLLRKRLLETWEFILNDSEVILIQKYLKTSGMNLVLRKRNSENCYELINPEGLSMETILETIESSRTKEKKSVKTKTTPEKKEDVQEIKVEGGMTKEIPTISDKEAWVTVCAIKAMQDATGKEAVISELHKLIERRSYTVIPEFRVRDILKILSDQYPEKIIIDGDHVLVDNAKKLMDIYHNDTPWTMTVISENITPENMGQILTPEMVVSCGETRGMNVYTVSIPNTWKGIYKGMNLVRFLRSGDYVSNPDFISEMKEYLSVKDGLQSKMKEIYENL